jgi:hypothetical protein
MRAGDPEADMNCRTVLMELLAILAAALILDLPLVGATQVNIMYWNGAQWVKWDDVEMSPQDLVNKHVTVVNTGGSPFWSNPKVVINISNSTMAGLDRAYVYKCKNLSPDDCVETVTPDMHEILGNDLDLGLPWTGVSHVITPCSSSPGSCLEVANLFFLFRVKDNGKIIWFGTWSRIERKTYNFTPPYLYEYSLAEVDLRAKADSLTLVRDFVETFMRLPFNTQWVSGAVFKGASSLYEISVSSSGLQQASPDFDSEEHTGNTISGISRDYSFVFPSAAYGTTSPLTLNLNPGFTCGQSGCESGLGESSVNCCYDCPCPAGYYCDGGTEGTCKLENLISLGLYETPDTVISNCNEVHVINLTAKVNLAPSEMNLVRSGYRLEETVYPTACDEIFHDVYRCPVTVPPMPDCEEGEYTIGPNYLNFTISFSDGPGTKEKIIATQFPDIVVGSFTCGQSGCESGLGESSVNCCYDCPCQYGYCDIADGAQPGTGTCRQDITDSSMQITARPTHFYTHNPAGDMVNLNPRISNSPVSLDIAGDSCGIGCYPDCSASCDVSCSEITSSDPDVFNASCIFTFIIADYDSARDYSLAPALNLSVTYNNGSSTVSRTLSRDFSTISVGASWCGDRVCTPGENLLTCCYDCPCLDGYYCDTADRDAPTVGDSCRLESDIRLVLEGPDETEFDYSDILHVTKLTVRVENAPVSLEGSVSCVFGDGSAGCGITCERLEGGSHSLGCNLSIPAIDYKTSPLYDPVTRRITLGPNTLNYSVTYNNGPGLVSRELSAGLPDIEINVKPRCGSGAGYTGFEEMCMPYNRTLACEGNLGENYETCCCDCPCPEGEYCYLAGDSGTCSPIGSIALIVEEFDPEPKECLISSDRKTCMFYDSLASTVRIEPEADYSYTDAYFEIGGEAFNAYCIPAPGESVNRYDCSFIPPNIEGTDIQSGYLNRNVAVFMSIRSTGLLDTTVSGGDELTISKVEGAELELLEEQLSELDRIQDKLKSMRTWIWVSLGALVALCTALCIWVAGVCGYCIAFGACVSIDLISVLIKIGNSLELIKGYKELLNEANMPGTMNIQETNVKYGALEISKTVLQGLVCLAMFGGTFQSIITPAKAAAVSETPGMIWGGSRYPIWTGPS